MHDRNRRPAQKPIQTLGVQHYGMLLPPSRKAVMATSNSMLNVICCNPIHLPPHRKQEVQYRLLSEQATEDMHLRSSSFNGGMSAALPSPLAP